MATDTVLIGSASSHPAGAQKVSPLHPQHRLFVVLILKPLAEPGNVTVRNVNELRRLFRSRSAHLRRALSYLNGRGIRVVDVSPLRHDIVIEVTTSQLRELLDLQLHYFKHRDRFYHGHDQDISLRAPLAAIVENVIGLDGVPLAQPSARLPRHSKLAYSPVDLAGHYNFPEGLDGEGERIAILTFGGGYHQSDMNAYFGSVIGAQQAPVIRNHLIGDYNRPLPRERQQEILKQLMAGVPISELAKDYGDDLTRLIEDIEVTQDIQIAGGAAPGAGIDVYFAPENALGYYFGIYAALGLYGGPAPLPAALSISWGTSESSPYLKTSAMQAIDRALQKAALLGVPVCCASGDYGSLGAAGDGDIASVTFPASSNHALAVGGTEFAGSDRSDEVVWNGDFLGAHCASGGGISGFFKRPAYQSDIETPAAKKMKGKIWFAEGIKSSFRGCNLPDLAAYADPSVGYRILVGGVSTHGGGTSASTPLVAGLIARLRQEFGDSMPWFNDVVHQSCTGGGFIPVRSGDNEIKTSVYSFSAQRGFDRCTGVGVPDGEKIRQLIRDSITDRQT